MVVEKAGKEAVCGRYFVDDKVLASGSTDNNCYRKIGREVLSEERQAEDLHCDKTVGENTYS